MLHPFLTSVGSRDTCRSVRGNRSLVNITPWPTNTSSSSVTRSQRNAWLSILQLRPMIVPRVISTNGPTNVPSPISQPNRLTSSGEKIRTSFPSLTSASTMRPLFAAHHDDDAGPRPQADAVEDPIARSQPSFGGVGREEVHDVRRQEEGKPDGGRHAPV